MSIWDDTITKKPDNARAWINRGNAFASMGRYDQAIRDLDRAIEIKPDSSEAHSNRGAAYASKRNADKAIGDLDKAIKLKPDYAKAYNNRAVAHFLRGDYGASWADVRKCQDLGGRVNPDFLANLIRASRGQ
jgi:tetratricopeptide (TPR) repeat protein